MSYRLAAYESVCHKIGFLAKLFDLSNCEIKTAATNLVKEYPNDLEACLESELVQFCILYKAVIRYTGIVDKGKTQQHGIEHEIYLTMKKNEWTQTFPNVDIASIFV